MCRNRYASDKFDPRALPLKTSRRLLLLLCIGLSGADEWGTWDDLPSHLLTNIDDSSLAIDRLYDKLKIQQPGNLPDQSKALENWLMGLNITFSDNAELQALLNQLKGNAEDNIADEIEKWLQTQIEETQEALEDEQDEVDDRSDDDGDDNDDWEDNELDELDDAEEPDSNPIEGSGS